MTNKNKWIILHHSSGTDYNPLEDTCHHTLEIINEAHRRRGFPISELGYYCGYQFVVEKTGKIRQARQVNEIGAHCKGMNDKSIGICIVGNFDIPFNKPTNEQTESLKKLLDKLVDKYGIDPRRIVPHRKFASKTCFGTQLKDDWGLKLYSDVIRTKIGLINQLIILYTKFLNFI